MGGGAELGKVEPSPEASTAGNGLGVWERIHHHKVIQWGLGYLGAALALAHGQELVGHAFHWPDLLGRVFMIVLFAGLPIALTLAWYHGHRGLQRIGAGELTIISLLMLIGAVLFTVALRPADEHAAAAAAPAPAETVVTNESVDVPVEPAIPPNSIAVIPFVNVSSDPEQEYFADGLSEELMNQLSKIDELFVTARTSSFEFKGHTGDIADIGRRLGVDHVLEGSVRKGGERVRITAQLVEAKTGFHLWSETYDRDVGDIFAVQDEVSRSVAAALKGALGLGDVDLSPGGTTNALAYDHYLMAQSTWAAGGQVRLVREELEKALELDPNFGLAQARLAAHLTRYLGIAMNPERLAELVEDRDRAIERALANAPELPETFWVLAQQHVTKLDWPAAEQALRQMMTKASDSDANASLTFGEFLLDVGRASEALPYLERARRLDPLAGINSVNVAMAHDALGNYERAAELQRNVERLPRYNVTSAMPRFWRELARGDLAATRTALEPFPAYTGDGPPRPNTPAAQLAIQQLVTTAVQHLDDPEGGREAVRALYGDTTLDGPGAVAFWHNSAMFAAYFGDIDFAAAALRQALQPNIPGFLKFTWIPILQPVRQHPDFKALMRDLKLVDYWRQSGWPDHCRPVSADDFECS